MRPLRIVGSLALIASPLFAQESRADAAHPSTFSVKGVVVDSAGVPLSGAEIYAITGERAISDGTGEFILNNLTERSVNLVVRRIGYTPVSVELEVAPTITAVSVRAKLMPVAVTLGTIVVEGKTMDKDLWDKGFYSRMEGAHLGSFFPPERFAHNASNVSTLMSEVPRVKMSVGRGGIAVPMAPYKYGTEYCVMSAIIDGMAFSSSVVGQVGIDNLVNVNDIKAMEVYLRAGRIPNMLSGRAGMQATSGTMSATADVKGAKGTDFGGSGGVECGTIVIWTRGH